MNEAYTDLAHRHQAFVALHRQEIHVDITSRLELRLSTASPDEKFLASAALRCLIRFKTEDGIGLFTEALDLSCDVPSSPLFALYLIWVEAGDDSPGLQDLLLCYLGYIQRGGGDDGSRVTDESKDDEPECATGALRIMLSVLPSVHLPHTISDGSIMLRGMLHEKLLQQYNIESRIMKNLLAHAGISTSTGAGGAASSAAARITAMLEEQEKSEHLRLNFVERNKSLLYYYACFLSETKQGRKVIGIASPLGLAVITVVVETTLDSWVTPPTTKPSLTNKLMQPEYGDNVA